MISVSNLAKSYGDHTLFAGATFQLNPWERYGLVGANGSGKTTLLSILTGDLEPSEGTVSIPKRAQLGALKPAFREFFPAIGHILSPENTQLKPLGRR